MTQPADIGKLVGMLHEKRSDAVVEVDAPRDPKGEWWLDISSGQFKTQIAWRAAWGFEFFTTGKEGSGDKPDEIYRKPAVACTRLFQLERQWVNSKSTGEVPGV